MASTKVFIVTGASKGLGAAIAKYLLGQSHKVVATARSADLLESLKRAHPGQVEYVAGDMTEPKMPESLTELAIKSFGRLDGLVINHGRLVSERMANSSIETFKNLYDVNVFSALAMAQSALPQLRKTNGCIVWVSSGAARNAYVGWSAYGSSKAVLNSLSTHLAAEEKGITSVTIEPGRVDTGMQAQIRSSGKDSMDKAEYEDFVNAFTSGKLVKPEQSGHVIARVAIDPRKDLSGKNLKWNSPELASYQE
ncbi:short-chain dehydrogenase [Moelleriella libera RCEF 2490]|uniref:Short-chain dehydrogenase n=1 Tax=Moelleriella libera RCEF 2490 TaxID=1081109 RepID=A0A166UTY7_9HYPO|nr:short-chain dehydrogenase [Moelleriella libera RCEF 2490]